MKTLIICVDRDNDIGEKAGIETPIIGKEESLSAATKLALTDPEDADINAIFESVRIYEKLKSIGEDAEIALIAGDKEVGIKSDRRIGEEVDVVLSKSGADNVIVVTDGAGDEGIIPIIQSRVKINSVRRVVVKQSKPLESSFYTLRKAFKDVKFSRPFFLPVGLIFLALAISLLVGRTEIAIGLILGIIGVYMLLRGLGLEEATWKFINAVKQSLYEGKITLVVYVGAFVLLLIGTLQGIIGSWSYFEKLGYDPRGYRILLSMIYTKWAIWWYVGGALFPAIGKIVGAILEEERGWKYWTTPFLIIASGLVIWGGSECIIAISEAESLSIIGYQILLFSILSAILISLIGVGISLYVRERIIKEKAESIAETEKVYRK